MSCFGGAEILQICLKFRPLQNTTFYLTKIVFSTTFSRILGSPPKLSIFIRDANTKMLLLVPATPAKSYISYSKHRQQKFKRAWGGDAGANCAPSPPPFLLNLCFLCLLHTNHMNWLGVAGKNSSIFVFASLREIDNFGGGPRIREKVVENTIFVR